MTRALQWVLAGLVLTFLVVPVIVVVPMSLGESAFMQFPPPSWSTKWYGEFFRDPVWTGAVMRSLRVALVAMLLSVSVGTVTAYAFVRGGLGRSLALEPLFALPMVVPVVVYGAGAYLLALTLGFTGSMWAIAVTHSVLALPFVLINVRAALESSDAGLERVAQTLGASRFMAFRTVVLPIIAPAVGAGALLSLVLSFDETVVALFLSEGTTPTLPVRMFSSIRYQLNPLVPVAATVMLTATASLGVVYLLIRAAARRHRTGPAR